MAFITSSDILREIAKEAVLGTVPTTGSRWEVPLKAGFSAFVKDGGEIVSDTIRKGRNANGSRRGVGSVSRRARSVMPARRVLAHDRVGPAIDRPISWRSSK